MQKSAKMPHRFYSLILASTLSLADGELWNSGVEHYEKGDVTNALRVLRPLLTSKSHAARAAAIVAKIEKDLGEFEAAAISAQVALRVNPNDEIAMRNFARAIDGIKAKRENAHIDEVLKSSNGSDAGAKMEWAVNEARAVMDEAGTYRTNIAEIAVAKADSLAKRAEILTDSWIPLREAIASSVTNEEQAATILVQLDNAKAKTAKASKELADMDGEAYATMNEVEHDFNRFLKLVAMPPQAMALDETMQSNAWQDVEAINGRTWQSEALEYTRAFRSKFPAWVRAYEAEAQADTNCPPFTAEDQAKISALATELEKLQLACVEKCVPASQESALEIIAKIRELLPKGKGGGGATASGKLENKHDNAPKESPKQDESKDNTTEQSSESESEDEADNQAKEESAVSEAEKSESEEDRDIDATLRKAQERNDEHEADKKARMRKAPLPPNERDW